MAQRFSLKDNPIFQKLAPHTPPLPLEATVPGEESQDNQGIIPEGQNLTVRNRPSEIDTHMRSPTETDDVLPSLPGSPPSPASTPGSPPHPAAPELPLLEHLDKALFFGFYNEVADELLPTLSPAAQVLYNRLFRLAYGFNRNYCIVSQPLLMERTGLSRNTLRGALQALLDGGWIQIVGAGNRVSTTYRVVLPREVRAGAQQTGAIFEGQNLTVRNRPSESDPQNLRVKNRGSEIDPPEGQNSALRNLTPRPEKPSNILNDSTLQVRGSKFEGQKLTPLLFTYRSSTLSLSEREREGQNSPGTSLLLSARELVDKFYSLLGQRVAKSKRQKSLDECLGLLHEGFTVEEIDYAISWLITHHPTTGSFSRLPHFIDQALKAQHNHPPTARATPETQRQRQQEQEHIEQQQRLQVILAALPPEDLAAFRAAAEKCVDEEQPGVKYGRDTLVRLKMEELITMQALPPLSGPAAL